MIEFALNAHTPTLRIPFHRMLAEGHPEGAGGGEHQPLIGIAACHLPARTHLAASRSGVAAGSGGTRGNPSWHFAAAARQAPATAGDLVRPAGWNDGVFGMGGYHGLALGWSALLWLTLEETPGQGRSLCRFTARTSRESAFGQSNEPQMNAGMIPLFRLDCE